MTAAKRLEQLHPCPGCHRPMRARKHPDGSVRIFGHFVGGSHLIVDTSDGNVRTGYQQRRRCSGSGAIVNVANS